MTRISAGLLLLAGCAASPPAPDPAPPPTAGTGQPCNAAAAQHLVGQRRSEELGREAQRLTGAATLRWIRPGDAVTMDYREDRLNIELDGNGRVVRLTCG